MSIVRKQIRQPYFDYIRDGIKTREGRAIGEFWNENLIGKVIEIYSENPEDGSFRVRITKLTIYDGNGIVGPPGRQLSMSPVERAIRKMLAAEGISEMLPDHKPHEFERSVLTYMSFNQGNLQVPYVGAFSVEVLDD